MPDREKGDLTAHSDANVGPPPEPESRISWPAEMIKEYSLGEDALTNPKLVRLAAEAICDRIRTVELVYRGAEGEVLFTHKLGNCRSGWEINGTVPSPSDFYIIP